MHKQNSLFKGKQHTIPDPYGHENCTLCDCVHAGSAADVCKAAMLCVERSLADDNSLDARWAQKNTRSYS